MSRSWDAWLPVMENSRLFAQCRHRAQWAPKDHGLMQPSRTNLEQVASETTTRMIPHKSTRPNYAMRCLAEARRGEGARACVGDGADWRLSGVGRLALG